MSIQQSINLNVDPYEGVGMFKLGQSLYQTIQLIQKKGLKLKIISNFSNQKGVKPVILIVEEYGLKLIFKSSYQTLVMIEIYQFNKVFFNRNGNVLNMGYRFPNFQEIYNKVFGPTYPGSMDSEDNYNLNYDGISFKFDLKNYTNSSKKLVKFINDNSQSIFCHAIFVYADTSINDVKNYVSSETGIKAPLTNKPISRVRISVAENSLSFMNDQASTATTKKGSAATIFKAKVGVTTMQDVLSCLGPPEDVLTINNDKYHNYYSLGCDFCYDLGRTNGCSSILKKVNIHNNLLNSFEFMKYERLNWELCMDDANLGYQKYPQVSNFDKYAEIDMRFKINCKPIFLNRSEYDLINSLNRKIEFLNFDSLKGGPKASRLAKQQINFELIDYEDEFDDTEDSKSDSTFNEDSQDKQDLIPNATTSKHELSSDTLSKNNYETTKDRSKDWGLTNLYLFRNFIFEVLIDTDEISMISIV